MTLHLKLAVILVGTTSCSATLSAELPRVPRSASMTDKASEHQVKREMRSDHVTPQTNTLPDKIDSRTSAKRSCSAAAVGIGLASGFGAYLAVLGAGLYAASELHGNPAPSYFLRL